MCFILTSLAPIITEPLQICF